MKIADADLEVMNRKLHEWFGETENKAHFRIVWADDQLEKRLTTHTKDGFELIRPEILEVPKYRQWIRHKYLIEKLTVVPRWAQTELIELLSYEPLFVFEDKHGNYLPPLLSVARIAIESTLDAIGVEYTKYKDPRADGHNGEEYQEQERKNMMEYLYANESDIGDALATRSGVGYGPGSSPNSSTPAIDMDKLDIPADILKSSIRS